MHTKMKCTFNVETEVMQMSKAHIFSTFVVPRILDCHIPYHQGVRVIFVQHRVSRKTAQVTSQVDVYFWGIWRECE